MKIAVFCPSFIGDTVMATPTFRALRRGFSGATLTAVIKPQVAPTLDGSSWFDDWIFFDHRSRTGRHRTLSVLRRLRRERFDLAILLPNSFRSGLMAFLGGIPRRVGYERHGRGILLTDVLHHAVDDAGRRLPTPIVDTYLKLARHLRCPVETSRLELATTPADEASADRAWSRLGLDRGEPVVCLNTGGAFGPAKNWPIGHFVDLSRQLAVQSGVRVLILCGPRESASARAIVAASAHERVVSLANQELGLGLTKACIRRSSLLITTDSGPRHFAAAFGTPVLTLFGPTHIAWTRTHHPLAWHVTYPVPCGPCQKRLCPEGHHKCMRDLAPESVYRIARRIIGTTASYAS
jgi:heptosyltransferase-2